MALNPQVVSLTHLAQHLLSHLPEKGHDSARAIIAQVRSLADAASRLAEMHSARNPTETDGAHTKKMSLAAQKLNKEVTATTNRIGDFLRSGREALSSRMVERTKFSPDAYAPEIRAVYRNASHTERLAMLKEWTDEGRGPELAAILKAPRSLTGATAEYIEQFTDAFLMKHAPDEMAELESLDETFDGAQTALRTAGDIATSYENPAKLAEIARAEAAAEAAAKAFEGRVGV